MDNLAYILSHLRVRDAEELREYGLDVQAAEGLAHVPHVLFRTWAASGNPAAACWFDALTPRALIVSLMATDDWPKVAGQVVRWGRRVAKPELLAMGYTRCECRTMAGHRDAVRLLEFMGFSLECRLPLYGATGKAFLQYSWR